MLGIRWSRSDSPASLSLIRFTSACSCARTMTRSPSEPCSATSASRRRSMTDIQVFGSHEPNTLEQLRDVASRAERAALMADGHLGYVMPIGGVAAYRDKVSVVGVGFDIACGNAAIRTDLTRAQLAPQLSALADGIQ